MNKNYMNLRTVWEPIICRGCAAIYITIFSQPPKSRYRDKRKVPVMSHDSPRHQPLCIPETPRKRANQRKLSILKISWTRSFSYIKALPLRVALGVGVGVWTERDVWNGAGIWNVAVGGGARLPVG